MDARGRRQAIIASIVTASLLVVAAIGTTAFFVIRSQQRSDDVAEAAHVASIYNKKVSAYRSSVQAALTSADSGDARKVRAAFKAAIVQTPKLGDAPEWGRTHSTSYIKAKASAKTLEKPYEEVSTVLDEAVLGQPLIKAANTALRVQIDDFLPVGTLSSGAPIRARLIPGFTKALARFNEIEDPPGAVTVANNVRAALKGVLIQAEKAADELDAGRSASINVRREYIVAATGVIAYDKSLRSRLESAIRKATPDVSGPSSELST